LRPRRFSRLCEVVPGVQVGSTPGDFKKNKKKLALFIEIAGGGAQTAGRRPARRLTMGTAIWVTGSGLWDIASNWITGAVPTPSDTVIIDGGEPDIAIPESIAGLTLDGGSLTIGASLAIGAGGLTSDLAATLDLATTGLTFAFALDLAESPMIGPVTIDIPTGFSDTFSGLISDVGSLAVAGGGALTLSGANSYSGGTTVNASTLIVGNNNGLGSNTVTLQAGSTLEFSTQTIQNGISLSGSDTIEDTASGNGCFLDGIIASNAGVDNLTISGAGSVALEGQVNVSGALTVSANAKLLLFNQGESQEYSGGVTVNSGALFGVDDDFDPKATKTITLESGSELQFSLQYPNLAFSPQIVLNGAATISGSGDIEAAGGIGGSGTLHVADGIVLELAGANNSFGPTSVDQSELYLATGVTYSSQVTLNSGTLGLSGGSFSTPLVNNGGDIEAFGGTSTLTANITGGGTSLGFGGSDATIVLTGNNTYTGRTLIFDDDTLSIASAKNIGSNTIAFADDSTLELTAAFALSNALSLASSGLVSTLEVTQSSDTFTGVISGAAALAITGGGAVLTGVNLYTGGTQVKSGTVKAGNAKAFGTNTVTVASGATLDLNGFTVGNAFNNNGTLTSSGGLADLTGAVTNNGAISIAGRQLTFAGNVTGAGTATIGVGGELVFDGQFNQNVTFGGPGGLTLSQSYAGVISGFNIGDTIQLANVTNGVAAAATLSGPNASGVSTLTIKSATGSTLATLSLQGDFAGLIPVVMADGAIKLTVLTTQHSQDFTGAGDSDIAFENTSGTIATWLQSDGAITGGGQIGTPGPAWTEVAMGDVNGDGVSDLIFSNSTTQQIAVWEMGADAIASSFVLAGPAFEVAGSGNLDEAGSWKVVGAGDFNGDGRADILFRDAAGDLATWDMNGGAIVGGGVIGNPGAGYTLVGTGDFNGDRKTDLLFENTNGSYAIWNLDDATVASSAAFTSPGAGWVFKGTGDFNGDGTSDILLENADTGEYAIWTMNNDQPSGVENVFDPGPDWTFTAIGDYGGTAESDLLFENVVTGQYATVDLNGAGGVAANTTVGAPGPSWSVVGSPPAVRQELSGALFFQDTSGGVASWNVEGQTLNGGGNFGNPGLGWTMLGVGDFYGDLQPDILFENTSGEYALWQTNGAKIVGGGNIGAPGGTWTFKAIGDFNGDGVSDILFEDAGGDYATWNMNGTSVISGGLIGNPGAGWSFMAAADFNGDGTSDLLFENTSGLYAIWEIGENQVIGGGSVGTPGSAWTFMGAGDFNGDGEADLLFENANGTYATWDLSGTAIVGGGAIGNPGAAWVFEGIADLGGDHQDSILFMNASTGQYATWELNDATIAGGATLGAPGAAWTLKAFV
jgi:autotransporter-associated beta strand protein